MMLKKMQISIIRKIETHDGGRVPSDMFYTDNLGHISVSWLHQSQDAACQTELATGTLIKFNQKPKIG